MTPGVGPPNPCTPKGCKTNPSPVASGDFKAFKGSRFAANLTGAVATVAFGDLAPRPGYERAALRAAQITSTESVLELTISVAWYVVIVVPHAPFRVRTTDRFGLACCATQILPFVGCREHVRCSTSAREVGCDPMGVWRADWTSRRRAMLLRRRNRQTPLRDHDPSIFHRC